MQKQKLSLGQLMKKLAEINSTEQIPIKGSVDINKENAGTSNLYTKSSSLKKYR